jgi:pimeloyl-ACP methyl ester carboxylesterase
VIDPSTRIAQLISQSTAKDYEAVRIALGNEPINIVAFSYGTVVGAQYAALFPDNLRSLALDAVIQHSQAESTNSFIEATSYALGFSRFLAWASNDTASALKGQDVRLLWNELLVNASTTPIPAPLCNNTNCRSDVNSEELLFNAQSYLVYSGKEVGLGSSWQILASALRNASNGDASTLSTVIADPTRGAAVATSCLDWTQDTSSSLADNLAQQRMMQEYAPLTQGHSQLWSLQHQCLGWPINAVNPPRKLDIKTNTTILMTHSTRDGLSGLPWALGMLEEITNKVLVLRDGDGHTSTPLAGETAETIIRYLITGKAPEDGLVLQS